MLVYIHAKYKTYSGSFYEDGALRGAGFNGEGIATGAVLVAKAHNMKRASWSTNNKVYIRIINFCIQVNL